jgi:hypothetical protein
VRNDEQENQAKPNALRTLNVEGISPAADGGIGGDELDSDMEKFMDELVAQITPENRYPEVSLGAEIEKEILE